MKADEDDTIEGKTPKVRSSIGIPTEIETPISPYITVAEDIEWFRDAWLASDNELPPPELRRGSATLRKLLVDGLIHEAWHAHEMVGAPMLVGPDLLAAIALHNHEIRHGASVIAGGAIRAGVVTCSFGVWRVANLSTGASADAEEGFAVSIEHISRLAGGLPQTSKLQEITEMSWKITAYLKAAGAIRRGAIVSRQEIIQYFANYAGGVHLEKVKASNPTKHAQFLLIEELEKSATAHDLNGVYFELLSIGQAVGRSKSLLELAASIRANTKGLGQ
jgi:hypothetical protein